jgi:ankyrin repeat protein
LTEGKNLLYVASSCGHTEIVELLLNNKADPNMCCKGKSLLYIASFEGHTEIVKLLLNNKADPNICCEGDSPIYIASLHGHTEIVKLLLNMLDNKADHLSFTTQIRISFIIQQQFDNLCMTATRSNV